LKKLLLCADDFGLSPAIDRGVLALDAARRLSAVSCIVNAPAWAADASALVASSVDCGLHFNLTEGRPLSPRLAGLWPLLPSLPRLIALAHLGRLPEAAVADELACQLAAFKAAAGMPPQHLDGHQHVQHLPGVRQAVLAAAARMPGLRLRDTGHVDPPGWWLKGGLIAGTGGRALSRKLHSRGLAQNRILLGVYDFGDRPYRALMQGWLQRLPADGALIFCHPGAAAATGEAAPDDPIAAARLRGCAVARLREMDSLMSPQFTTELAAAGVSLRMSSSG